MPDSDRTDAPPAPGPTAPLRLALVRQRYRPDGGAERFVDAALSALAGEGVAVSLLSRGWRADRHPPALPIRHVRCDPWWLTRIGREHGFARAVGRTLARHPHDLVQTHERIPGCDVFRAGDGLHRSWLAERARSAGALGRFWLRCSPFHRYRLAVERRLFAHPSLRAVICNSDMVRREIIAAFGLPAERLHVIYNGVDTQRFHPGLRRHRAAIRARLGIDDTLPVLLFAGSGYARKGLEAALAALQRCARAHLLVVGRDKREAHYVRMAARLGLAGRVHFAGMQREIEPWYGASDGLLLPTLYDPFPNVVLEAMAAGLGVITSTRCGGAELVREGREGYVRDALDVPALAAAIAAFEDAAHARALGAAARLRVAPYTVERMTARLLALYRELLAETVIAR